jgi:hypothetical protein
MSRAWRYTPRLQLSPAHCRQASAMFCVFVLAASHPLGWTMPRLPHSLTCYFGRCSDPCIAALLYGPRAAVRRAAHASCIRAYAHTQAALLLLCCLCCDCCAAACARSGISTAKNSSSAQRMVLIHRQEAAPAAESRRSASLLSGGRHRTCTHLPNGNLRPRPGTGHQPTSRRDPPQMHQSGHSSRTCSPAARSPLRVR